MTRAGFVDSRSRAVRRKSLKPGVLASSLTPKVLKFTKNLAASAPPWADVRALHNFNVVVKSMTYLFCKWLHFIAVISWMAGILYLYRLFINHVEAGESADNHKLLSGMEDRLYRYITRPAMIVAWIAGTGMLMLNLPLLKTGWIHTKLLCLLLLTVTTIYAGRLRLRFAAREQNLPSSRQLRILNEVPTLFMMIIVAMAVFRPF